jgi:hypothetical protein
VTWYLREGTGNQGLGVSPTGILSMERPWSLSSVYIIIYFLLEKMQMPCMKSSFLGALGAKYSIK